MDNLLQQNEMPDWFSYPENFSRVIDLELINLEPWVMLLGSELRARYQGLKSRYPERELIPFAKRIDNDDIVCWEKGKSDTIMLIHDYASVGYEQRGEFDDFWLWFKSAIDDLVNF